MSKAKAEKETLQYRSYVSDLLKSICEWQGTNVNARYYELIQDDTFEETRSADEIIGGISQKIIKLTSGGTENEQSGS